MIKQFLASKLFEHVKERFTKENLKSKTTKAAALPAAAGAGFFAMNGTPETMEEAVIYAICALASLACFWVKEKL